MSNTLFITGTDTGVGKTLLTALLLAFFQQRGVAVRAIKPFCSGGRSDIQLFYDLQKRRIPKACINPFYFPESVAPFVAMRRRMQMVPFAVALESVLNMQADGHVLLVEGCGGLLVPLGEHYAVADLIRAVDCPAIVVAENRLGSINHILLSVQCLSSLNSYRVNVVLMNRGRRNLACLTNMAVLAEWLAPVRVFQLPYLGNQPLDLQAVLVNSKKLKKTLAQIAGIHTFSSAFM